MSAPTITNLTPTFGPARNISPVPVTINGTGFTAASVVQFGPGRFVLFTVVNDNTIQVPNANADLLDMPTVPSAVAVTVTTPSGTSTNNAHNNFIHTKEIGRPIPHVLTPTSYLFLISILHQLHLVLSLDSQELNQMMLACCQMEVLPMLPTLARII